jgi:hypothetical protein
MDAEEEQALDAEVAVKVMGWQWAVEECSHPALNHGRCRKPDGSIVMDFTPSTKIAAAWLVVERFVLVGCFVDVQCGYPKGCICLLDDGHGRAFAENGKTAPLAICRAALKAVEAL